MTRLGRTRIRAPRRVPSGDPSGRRDVGHADRGRGEPRRVGNPASRISRGRLRHRRGIRPRTFRTFRPAPCGRDCERYLRRRPSPRPGPAGQRWPQRRRSLRRELLRALRTLRHRSRGCSARPQQDRAPSVEGSSARATATPLRPCSSPWEGNERAPRPSGTRAVRRKIRSPLRSTHRIMASDTSAAIRSRGDSRRCRIRRRRDARRTLHGWAECHARLSSALATRRGVWVAWKGTRFLAYLRRAQELAAR